MVTSKSGASWDAGRGRVSDEARRAVEGGQDWREPHHTLALVPGGARFEGLIAFCEAALLEGEIEGSVLGEGTLRLAAGARILGDVDVARLELAGEVEGEVLARRVAKLEGSACLSGRLRAAVLRVEDGARVDAECEVDTSLDPARPKTPDSP